MKDDITKRIYIENQLIVNKGFYTPNNTYNFQYVLIDVESLKPQYQIKLQKSGHSFVNLTPIFFNQSRNQPLPNVIVYVWFKVILPSHITLLQHKSFDIIMNKDFCVFKNTTNAEYATQTIEHFQSTISRYVYDIRYNNEVYPHLYDDKNLETLPALISSSKLVSLLIEE